MSTFELRLPRVRRQRPGLEPAAWFRRAFARIRLWRERARQRRCLAALNDRMLRDVGLTRGDVMAETSKPFWRP